MNMDTSSTKITYKLFYFVFSTFITTIALSSSISMADFMPIDDEGREEKIIIYGTRLKVIWKTVCVPERLGPNQCADFLDSAGYKIDPYLINPWGFLKDDINLESCKTQVDKNIARCKKYLGTAITGGVGTGCVLLTGVTAAYTGTLGGAVVSGSCAAAGFVTFEAGMEHCDKQGELAMARYCAGNQ